jgi:hypothetical protein
MGNLSTFFTLMNYTTDQRFLPGSANKFFNIRELGAYFSSTSGLASGLLYEWVKMERREKK